MDTETTNSGFVSIIIVSYNAKEFLKGCLSSIYEAEITLPFEVIVVDNNSSDGTGAMVGSLFPQVILLRNRQNLGFARANNVGIRASHGRYLFLLNSDNCIQFFA